METQFQLWTMHPTREIRVQQETKQPIRNVEWRRLHDHNNQRRFRALPSATAANEYMALSPATKSAIWLRQFLQELGMGEFVSPPTRIYGDNNTANQWVDEEKITQENMGILQGYHYVKVMAAAGQIEVMYVNTKFNLADLFTTAVPKEVMDALEPCLCGRQALEELIQKAEEVATQKKEETSDSTQ